MKIAVVGSGISGLTCSYLLQQNHDLSLYEKSDRIGGHTATLDVEHKGREYSIDTGFIVYNDQTYPDFKRLMATLGIGSRPASMGFSVSCDRTGLEYSGKNLDTLFAQRLNLVRKNHLSMVLDILRFNKRVLRDLENGLLDNGVSLGTYLDSHGYSRAFIDFYLIPMGSAIWSSPRNHILEFPALFFARFFKNHGLLNIKDRPCWRVLKGGSKSYLEPLTRDFKNRIHTRAAIEKITRQPDSVSLHFASGEIRNYDHVVLACHSDQAVSLLGDPSEEEKDILAALPYRDNEVVLHTDESVLPRLRKTWSSWNYHLGGSPDACPSLSYNMNILQGIDSDTTFIVTLNATNRIDPDKVLASFNYAHPVFSIPGIAAQNRRSEINGKRRTWYCGAYWQNGFHEDGCASGISVARALGCSW